MSIKLFVFLFFHNTPSTLQREVAVIIGGLNDIKTDSENPVVEIYTSHLSCTSDLSSESENIGELFAYNGYNKKMSGLYLDNIGIFLCGGQNQTQGPDPKTVCAFYEYGTTWTSIPYYQESHGGIYGAAIEQWDFKIDNEPGLLGFLHTGGIYYGQESSPTTAAYKYLEGNDTVFAANDTWRLRPPRSGHCFPRVKTNVDDRYQYLAIGGVLKDNALYEYMDYLYCNDANCTNWLWDRTQLFEGLGGLSQHSCTVFRHEDKESVLVAGGRNNNQMTSKSFIISYSRCDPDSYKCDWEIINQSDLPTPLYNSELITLDGVPHMFGGSTATTATSAVFRFNQSWEELETMKAPRQNHVALSIPEEWLCFGDFYSTIPPPTVTTTVSDSSTSTPCPTDGLCSKTDQRGESWSGTFGEMTEHDCLEGNGTARWLCNGCDFEEFQPDRSECVADWVGEVENEIQNTEITSLEISNNILENTKPPTDNDPGITGGSIIKLFDQYGDLFIKHDNYNGDSDYNHQFTENIVKATSVILRSDIGWNEIHDELLRFETSSEILLSMDNLGYIFGKAKQKKSQTCLENIKKFTSDYISLNVRNLPAEMNNDDACFVFDSSQSQGSICLPNPSYVAGQDCLVHVATAYATDVQRSQIFPTRMEKDIEDNELILHNNLLGLTIENGDVSIDISEDDQPIVITFLHDKLQISDEDRTCVYWDFPSLSWLDDGCQLSSSDSNDFQSVCHCRHLTNFGIIFDYSGKSKADDPYLNTLSSILLVISCMAILTTQGLLFFIKTDLRSSQRKTSENNRNLSLFFAQISFLVLSGQHGHVSQGVCQAFGALTHVLYLSFFAWTALEGYFFYRALVTVFDTSRLSTMLHYSLGYGVPLLIMVITLIVSEAGGDTLYLRRNGAGDVVACWLEADAVLPAMVIPAGLVLLINTCITGIAVRVAHGASSRRNMTTRAKILATMRNTILLSLLLGMTWITAIFYYSPVQQYITVILNASTGLYILAYSVLANREVRGEVREKISDLMSSFSQENK